MYKFASADKRRLLRIAGLLPVGHPMRRAVLVGLTRQATEFSSKEELAKYLKSHPDADPKNHSVKKQDSGTSKTVSGILNKMKGAKASLVAIIKKAPEATQKMLFDSETRKEAMSKISEGVKKAPGKLASKIYESAKGEFEDFGHAMKASTKLLKKPPGPFTKEDKAAFYSAGSYITGAVLAAIPPGGAIAALGAVASSFKMHVGIKAASQLMDKGFLHFEWAETALAVVKMGGEDKDEDKSKKVEEAFFRALAENIADQLKDLDDDAIAEIMKGVKEA